MIQNLTDLAREVGAARDEGSVDEVKASIARRLFKDTRCGISFWTDGATVTVAGYCEGVDVPCLDYDMAFPFKEEEFWQAVEAADNDGCEMWDQTHGCEDCGDEVDGHIPVNPECGSCSGSGVII